MQVVEWSDLWLGFGSHWNYYKNYGKSDLVRKMLSAADPTALAITLKLAGVTTLILLLLETPLA
ncbi:hypothetical protein ACFL3A_07925 [Pseudomonadota bacterium]